MSRLACHVITHVPVSSPLYLFSRGGSQVLKIINKVKQIRYNFTLVSVTDTRVKLYRVCLTLLISFKTCANISQLIEADLHFESSVFRILP